MNEAISDLRVDYRWQAIDQENTEMELAREVGVSSLPTCSTMETLAGNCLHVADISS